MRKKKYQQKYLPGIMTILFILVVQGVWCQLSKTEIDELRRNLQSKGASFTIGENPATKRPLSSLCGLKIPPKGYKSTHTNPSEKIHITADLPVSFDWREQKGDLPVRDQEGCGACWAFGTVAPLESNLLIKNKQETDLSEQWLVSCNANDWNCDGGWWAHDYHINPGAVYESEFPYVAANLACGGPYYHPYHIKEWHYVYTEYSVAPVDMIKQALTQYGPVASAIYVGYAFQSYTGGVFNVSESGSTIVNHGVTIVGWDDTMGSGCWIIRNSWGVEWGENGYMYITYGTSKIGYAANYIVFESSVDYVSHSVDDDDDGGSEGNANGDAEPGETIELYLILRNNTPTTVTSVTADIALSDPYVISLIEDHSFYGEIAPLSEKICESPYILSIGEPVPQGHRIAINLAIESHEGSWNTYLLAPIHSDPVIKLSSRIFKEETETSAPLQKSLIIGNDGIWELDFTMGALPSFGSLPDDYPSSFALSKGFGGPDNSGYTWIDSNEPDGPPFDWIEIKDLGSALLLGDDDAAQASLPFPFPFYGSEKDSLLISSNGYITFGAEGEVYSNHPIPYNQAPNDIIAPRWRDFNPAYGSQGIVYHYYDPSHERFIIEWRQFEPYPSGEPETFQVILMPDGTIRFQYLKVAKDKAGTVGIENANGDDGLQIALSNAYLDDEKTIFISPGVEWISFEPGKGKVLPGENCFITITFNVPYDFDEGIHTSRILIKSNDPMQTVILPVALDVWGIGPQIIHTPYEDTYNETGPYLIEAEIRTKSGFAAPGPVLYWKLQGDAAYQETYMINAEGATYQASIPGQPADSVIDYYLYARDIENEIKTNPKEAPAQFHQFRITPKPGMLILGLSPLDTLLPSDSKGMIYPAFHIQNTGNDSLKYSIDIEYAPDSAKKSSNAALRGNSILSQSAGDIIQSWNVPSCVVWPWGIGCDGTNVWVGGTGDESSPPYTCDNWEFDPDGTGTGRRFSCDSWRGDWTADMTWDGTCLWQINVGGDNGIYRLDPANGNVINSITDPQGIWSGASQRGLAYCPDNDTFYIGGWESGKIYHIEGLSHPEPGAIISSFSFPEVSGLEWHPAGSLWIATHGNPDMIYEVNPEDGAIQTQFPHPAQGASYGGGLAIDGKGDLWVTQQGESTIYQVESGSDVFNWLSVDPTQGTVETGDERSVNLYFDTQNLSDGLYSADLSITSNDPEQDAIRIPVSLQVNSDTPLPEWNIMLYLDGDNNLEPYAILDFMEASSVLLTADTKVLIQMDRIEGYSADYGAWTICHRFVLEPGMTPQETNAVSDWGDAQGGREVNMADPAILSDFVNWGISNYPAKRYAVILWNHGEGWRNMEKTALKAVCYDETSKDYMFTSEMGSAFQNILPNLDIIGIDACLMGMIEVGYEISNEGDIFIASEDNIPVAGWPYDTILEDLATSPAMSAEALSKAMVRRYGESYNMDRTLAATDLNQMNELAFAVTELADALIQIDNQWACVAEARNAASFYDSFGEYRDMSGFVQALITCASDESIRQKAQNLKDALDAANIARHYPDYLPSFGLSTYFVNPSKSSSIDSNYNCSNLQYACDTSWDEFLQAFLTKDVIPPTIQHIPLSNTLDTAGPYHIQTNIVDSSGVKESTVFWRKNYGILHRQKLNYDDTYYVGDIPGPSKIGDHYAYRIEALDIPGNKGYYPGPRSAYFRSFDIGGALQGIWEEFTIYKIFDLSHKRIRFLPNLSDSHKYEVCTENASSWSVDPAQGAEIFLGDDSYAIRELNKGIFPYWGREYDRIYIGSNGYITLINGDTEYNATLTNHFKKLRISPAFIDFNPLEGGSVKFQEMSDRAVVTFIEIKEYDIPGTNSFQVELFYTGMIRFTYLDMSLSDCIVGLSNGQGVPQGEEWDFSVLSGCTTNAPPSVTITTPDDGQKGNVSIEYTLYDANSNPSSLHIQMSTDNGVTWRGVTDGIGGDGRNELTASPGGVNHTFVWNAMADLETEKASSVKIQITPFHTGVGLAQETNQFTVYNPSASQLAGYLLGVLEAPGGNQSLFDVNHDGLVDIGDLVTTGRNQ
ncbi:hypothetical protein JW926_02305 [Candidatus Sumerlaeota bacterium]|nr:hypothetical protein [Candidatus Sumerlaeota bacterium]